MFNETFFPACQGFIDMPMEHPLFCAGTEITARHDPLTRQLPPEIVGDIFGFTLPCTAAFGRASPLVKRSSNNAAALKLGGVCRTWRAIAWSTPQLWTDLYILIDLVDLTRNPRRLELAQDWLSRAGQLPLSLRIVVTIDSTPRHSASELQSFKPFVSLINRYSARWKDLDIACPDWFLMFLAMETHGSPILQRLCISSVHDPWNAEYASFDLGSDLPAPMEISVAGCSFTNLHIRWNNATRVNIEGITLVGCFHILKQAPNLADANFSRVLVMNSLDIVELMESMDQPIVLHGLRHLQLDLQSSIMHEVMDLFFASLTLPALTQLGIGLVSLSKHLTPVIALIRRSSCQITSLSLTRKYSRGDEHNHLVSLLHETPELRQLQVAVKYGRGQPHPQTRLIQLLAQTRRYAVHESRRMLDSRPFLPNLKSFHCGIGRLGGRPFPWADVPDLFGSPQDSCQLKQLRVSWIREVPPPYCEKETALRLLELIDVGIHLDMRDTKGELDLLQLSIDYHSLSDA
ncbi:hypothetical protein CVT25_013419 [Psilocybe cyanescens]|uniref:F-box domain-containing protein n=1 Tax=Psilocybe cyanescens TaxID=93625 RepID=A0A409WSX8_PSICY|nr:hypothetical protein CVT25_013419 [Psilocybe cyanescens]